MPTIDSKISAAALKTFLAETIRLRGDTGSAGLRLLETIVLFLVAEGAPIEEIQGAVDRGLQVDADPGGALH